MFEIQLEHLYSMTLLIFASLVPVLNPFGGAMFFVTLTNGVDTKMRARMANRIGLYSAIVLFVSFYAGSLILSFFGISIDILRVAGGIVLFSAGWQTLNAPSTDEGEDPKPKSARALSSMAFYPCTLPLTTGPGSISVAVAFGANPMRSWGDMAGAILGIILSAALVWFCYRFSDRVTRAVGVAGSDAIARIFAFILICIGVATFWMGFSHLWAQLPASVS